MDSGIDDIIAILVALRSRDVSVVGISTVHGNVNPSVGILNVLKVLKLESRLNIPVFEGANVSLKNRPLPSNIKRGRAVSHGRHGLGNIVIDYEMMNDLWKRITPDDLKKTRVYSDFIGFILRRHPHDNISIIATGPLTNIASLIIKNDIALERVNEISIMGGSYSVETGKAGGCIAGPAEFNFYSDPEAAEEVLNSRRVSTMKIIGLNLSQSHECSINPDTVNRICTYNDLDMPRSESSKFLASLLNYKLKQNALVYLHDVLAVFMLEEPSIFRFAKGNVEVLTTEGYELGVSVFNKDEIKGHVSLAFDINRSKFLDLLQKRLRGNQK